MNDAAILQRKLVSELTQLDEREAQAEMHRRYPVNIYRLGHYLEAAERFQEAIGEGRTPEQAFSQTFVATRGMHTVARHLGLRLDVERGAWIVEAPTP